MLEVKDVCVRYGDRSVIDHVSLAVRPGEFTVVLGRNGAGKSTLLKALAGDFSMPSIRKLSGYSGTTLLNDEPITSIPADRLARTRAVLSQSFQNTFPIRVEELVSIGRYPHLSRASRRSGPDIVIDEVLGLAGVAHLKTRDVTTLSGGELARAQFARTLAQLWLPPDADSFDKARRFLLLDEPTAALDLVHQHKLFSTVKALTRTWGIGALAIAHDCNLAARYADRMIFLSDGRLIAEGAPHQVVNEAVIEQCFGLPVRVVRDDVDGTPYLIPASH
ncbi:heme ABC transporter ATP-binding protein [Paraburkholderia sp.]|uniref:heme ABC transporter ATP-binding protein n=1 Tax=Paraburkholderia sp. TaxID=1926495 RepID=UPI0023A6BC23|nr:heme ABC transporter ATP-binding protein [Paraburkholderia sp.]MDE1181930.1 heme ABC transporter ATP-binding protein [Paraburkholderia sp.]